jgi:hypothetical protein
LTFLRQTAKVAPWGGALEALFIDVTIQNKGDSIDETDQ